METDEEEEGAEGEEAPVDDKAAVVFTAHKGGIFSFLISKKPQRSCCF